MESKITSHPNGWYNTLIVVESLHKYCKNIGAPKWCISKSTFK